MSVALTLSLVKPQNYCVTFPGGEFEVINSFFQRISVFALELAPLFKKSLATIYHMKAYENTQLLKCVTCCHGNHEYRYLSVKVAVQRNLEETRSYSQLCFVSSCF